MLRPGRVEGTKAGFVACQIADVLQVVPVRRFVPPPQAARTKRLPRGHLFALRGFALRADERHFAGGRVGPMLKFGDGAGMDVDPFFGGCQVGRRRNARFVAWRCGSGRVRSVGTGGEPVGASFPPWAAPPAPAAHTAPAARTARPERGGIRPGNGGVRHELVPLGVAGGAGAGGGALGTGVLQTGALQEVLRSLGGSDVQRLYCSGGEAGLVQPGCVLAPPEVRGALDLGSCLRRGPRPAHRTPTAEEAEPPSAETELAPLRRAFPDPRGGHRNAALGAAPGGGAQPTQDRPNRATGIGEATSVRWAGREHRRIGARLQAGVRPPVRRPRRPGPPRPV